MRFRGKKKKVGKLIALFLLGEQGLYLGWSVATQEPSGSTKPTRHSPGGAPKFVYDEITKIPSPGSPNIKITLYP